MRHSSARAILYRLIRYADVGIAFGIALVYGAVRWNPAQVPLPRFMEGAATWAQSHGLFLLLLLPFLSYLTRLRKFLHPPVTWEVVHALLTQLQRNIFKDEEGPQYNHRVTLFVRRGWLWAWCRWPWSGFLVPVERSGQSTRKSTTRFRCAPERHPGIHQGVAGQTWVEERIIVVQNLPDIAAETNPAIRDGMIKKYARETWVPPEWVRDRLATGKTLALSYVGIPVEINGIVKGVVVIDSRNPKAPPKTKYSSAYDLVAKLLSAILKKGVDLGQ